jgi:monovalent cation/hydrogen antiporter
VHLALTLVVLVAVVTAVGALARRFGLPAPLILALVGAIASFVSFIPPVVLTPDLVLFGLLPPLLYAASIRTSLIDFRHNLRPIGLLSVGLVLFTALGVGLVVWLMLPVRLPVALALGAVVAPPDAVAATAIARRVGMPRRMVTILEGESLVNDATALVCLRVAVAATVGTVTAWSVAGEFVLAVGGGLLAGFVVALVVGKLRKRIDDPLTDTSVSLVTPFVSYLLAESIHASGVLALVVTGLLLGHMSPRLQSASSRIFERTNWATIQFVLENTVFLLIGLQVEQIVADLSVNDLPRTQVAAVSLAVLAAVVLLRFLWVFPALYLPGVLPPREGRKAPTWTTATVISWAGMRGVVTLAAVFVLPDVQHREVLVLIALVVVVGTLLLQGSTLPYLVRRVGLSGPDPRKDALAEAETYQRAAGAGIQRLDELVTDDDPGEVIEELRRHSLDRANTVWERLGNVADETPSQAYARLRAQMLEAEREEVLRVRRRGGVPHEVIERVLASLDIEETVLERVRQEDLEERGEELHATPHARGRCRHLRAVDHVPSARTPEGCEECLAEGMPWVHLRLCLQCGHVGCCDSSQGRHASRHYEATRHPVVRSFESGEGWRWCFVDDVLG